MREFEARNTAKLQLIRGKSFVIRGLWVDLSEILYTMSCTKMERRWITQQML